MDGWMERSKGPVGGPAAKSSHGDDTPELSRGVFVCVCGWPMG